MSGASFEQTIENSNLQVYKKLGELQYITAQVQMNICTAISACSQRQSSWRIKNAEEGISRVLSHRLQIAIFHNCCLLKKTIATNKTKPQKFQVGNSQLLLCHSAYLWKITMYNFLIQAD